MARGRFCVFVFAVVAALFVVVPGASQAPASRAHDIELPAFQVRSAVPHPLYADPFERNFVYGLENLQPRLAALQTSSFVITYDAGFAANAQAQAAFQKAAEIWGSIISSGQPIRVAANFTPQASNLLGSASPGTFCANFAGAPITSTWYPIALADKFFGGDACSRGTAPDIVVNLNSSRGDWSFDTTGANIPGQYSFLSVALHELGHGLGFLGSMTTNGQPAGTAGWGLGGGIPVIYDRFTQNGAAQALTDTSLFPNPSSALLAELTSNNIFFSGPAANASNGSVRPRLYAPGAFNPGSSYSHLDEIFNGTSNALMTFSLATNERIYDPGPVVKGVFTDIGWTVGLGCSFNLSSTSASIPLAGGSGSFNITTSADCGWTAVSNATFISISSGAGTGNGTISFTVAPSGSPRAGTISIAGQTFTVSQGGGTLPTMTFTPASINMAAVNNGGGTLLSQTPPQTLALTQVGAGTVTWTATSDSTWLTLAGPSGTGTSTSGTGPANLTLSINNSPPVLPTMGTRTATVTVTTSGAANNPTATVHLTVYLNGMTNVPAGQVDTPSPGATNVTGSIAVTGWAIDDVGVVSTKICRLPVAGESAPPNPNCNNQAQIFIGDGTFINGARPDVAAAFPNSPQKDRAGWGYLLLTNFLPSSGNGTFTLVTWVTSSDGQTVQIDARAITCTNATATAPFGAIDTPEQGGTASGASYVNFGWVLAAQPTDSGLFIPIDGSTVQVFVDGISRGVLDSYNNARPDIQADFPGYFNTDGAVGFKFLNTTTLTNGLHTIFWIAADFAGTAAGIGSRFFTVSNSALIAESMTEATEGPGSGVGAPVAHGHPSAAAQGFASSLAQGFASPLAQDFSPAPAGAGSEDLAYTRSFVDAVPRVMGDLGSVAWLRHRDAAVAVTHGFDAGAQPELVMPDAQFVRVVRTVQLDRVLIDLSATGDGAATYRGYTLDGELLRGLPVGSTLDAETGHFAWAVGLGFGGSHDLVFVRTGAHESAQIRVRVEIAAESASKGEPRLVIDTPVHDATVGGQFTIAGWAFDPNGPGTGVDTLHVWAYPEGAGGSGLGAGGAEAGLRDPGAGLRTHTDPIWIGVAAHGGVRPDVGNAFGARFAASGYSVEAAGLAPGTYDIVVYAHSTATSSFRIARMVRVTVR